MKDNADIQLEHYKLMRQEILQNSTEMLKALEIGIFVISISFTLAGSNIVSDDIRWLVFLFPSIAVSPLIMLMAQRFRQTRKIGTYIRLRIEPKLQIEWESNQQKSVKSEAEIKSANRRVTPRSLVALSMPLEIIQLFSWIVSLYYLVTVHNNSTVNPTINWIIWSATSLFIAYLLILEYRVIQEAINKDFSKDV
jgi:hypothetical protein